MQGRPQEFERTPSTVKGDVRSGFTVAALVS